MDKKQYKLIDRFVRRVERLRMELDEAWMPVTKILLRRELAVTYQTMNELFTKAEIKKVVNIREDAKNNLDRYRGCYWLIDQIYEKYADETPTYRSVLERRFRMIRAEIARKVQEQEIADIPF